MAHMIIRSLFGIGEAGNFPASIKIVAEWFPKKERALATGIFNSGPTLGAIIAPPIVVWVTALGLAGSVYPDGSCGFHLVDLLDGPLSSSAGASADCRQ